MVAFRLGLLAVCCAALSGGSVFGAETPVALAPTGAVSAVAGIGSVRLRGPLGRRLQTMIERHVMGTDIDAVTAPFMEKIEISRGWQTEFWGKYMHAAVPYAVYTGSGELAAAIERGVARVLASQEPCGYIGNYPDAVRCGEGWDVWGMKYTMMGLLHHYDMTGSEASLRACRRLCDYLIGELGENGRRGVPLYRTGNWSGMASSSVLEPVMWLYNRTREPRYLAFADTVVEGMEKPADGPRLVDLALRGVSVADRNGYGTRPDEGGGYVNKQNRWKAYEMMSCYQGLIEYAVVTGRKDLFEAALRTAEDIAREEVNLAGGCASSEAWYHGAAHQHQAYQHLQETCVTTTWMRLCEKLLELTDDPRWADQIEQTFYNAYLAALKPDGSEFAGYTPLNGNRYHGQNQCHMHTDCCTANGPRGFLCFLRGLFRTRTDAATLNFYASSFVKGTVGPEARPVSFELYTLYPRTDTVRIVSHTEGAGCFPLRLRIPAWSACSKVSLNGEALSGVRPGSYFAITRDWRLGDVVEIRFDMPVIAHRRDHWSAFTRGPVLLARDSRFGDGSVSEVFRGGLTDGEAVATFRPVAVPTDDMWMAFSATLPIGQHWENPEAANWSTVFFCDFASAGNTWRRMDHYRTWFEDERHPMEDLVLRRNEPVKP